MSPPKLAADAPVTEIFVPGLEGLGVACGVKAQMLPRDTGNLPVLGIVGVRRISISRSSGHGLVARVTGGVGWGNRTQRRTGQPIIRHLAIPLIAQIWLDRHVASITMPHAVAIGL